MEKKEKRKKKVAEGYRQLWPAFEDKTIILIFLPFALHMNMLVSSVIQYILPACATDMF